MTMLAKNFHKSSLCGSFFYAVWSLNGEINYLMCNLAACVSIKIVTTNKPITLDLTLWLKLLSVM